jgi:hypothetical protein
MEITRVHWVHTQVRVQTWWLGVEGPQVISCGRRRVGRGLWSEHEAPPSPTWWLLTHSSCSQHRWVPVVSIYTIVTTS